MPTEKSVQSRVSLPTGAEDNEQRQRCRRDSNARRADGQCGKGSERGPTNPHRYNKRGRANAQQEMDVILDVL